MTADAQPKLNARYGAPDISPATQWNESSSNRAQDALTAPELRRSLIVTVISYAICHAERDLRLHPLPA